MLEKLPTFKYYLVVNDTDYEITEAPDGWEDTEVSWKKDTSKYFGNTQEFSFPFKFVLEGARYLRRVLYTQGVDGATRLKVMKLNPTTESYYLEFDGEFDLSGAKDELTGVEVNIMNDGTTAKLKSLESTEFEFPFDENAINVRVPGVDLVQFANNYAATGLQPTYSMWNKVLPETQIADSYLPIGGFDVFSQVLERSENYNFGTSTNFMIEANENKQVNINGSIDVSFRNISGQTLKMFWRLCVYDNTSNVVAVIYSSIDETVFNDVRKTINLDTWFNIESGKKYFLVVDWNVVSSSQISDVSRGFIEFHEAFVNINDSITTEAAIVKVLRPIQVFQRLMDKISLGSTAQSYLLSQKNDVITSGEAIRGLPNPILKTSFTNFYKSVDAQYCTGLDIDDTNKVLRIEEREFFFRRPYVIANIGEVKDLVVEPYTELLASDIKVGYNDNSYEVERGRYEFNSEQQFTTTSRRVNRSIEIKSPYRADQFGIEELRVKQMQDSNANATETDNKWDNSVFWLRIKAEPGLDGVYDVETAEDFDNVDGVVSRTSTYNIALSPKSMLLRHIDFLCSSFFGANEDGNITFASSAKNADLSYTKNGVVVTEKAPIYIADITSQGRVFLPFLCTFTAKYPKSLQNLIKTSPYGCLQFSFNGNTFRGFIVECSVDLAKDSEQEFKLLLTSDTNLANFL